MREPVWLRLEVDGYPLPRFMTFATIQEAAEWWKTGLETGEHVSTMTFNRQVAEATLEEAIKCTRP